VCTINLILGVSTPKSDVNRLILVKVSLNAEKVYEYCVICDIKVLLIFWRWNFSCRSRISTRWARLAWHVAISF